MADSYELVRDGKIQILKVISTKEKNHNLADIVAERDRLNALIQEARKLGGVIPGSGSIPE